ncbi:hypothetical protein AJ79_07432 [Helicocarpus griseus UAMH5409]|uniref:Uncharacterized protein n=1 Tax=Helicocarpus griseus UAMH5409 TaxID=1447875 RepID=A0A2B7X396_9EURO|nr:hypothetical protein AJ79_07432 [Helicocarpus griseus UAMH5409]
MHFTETSSSQNPVTNGSDSAGLTRSGYGSLRHHLRRPTHPFRKSHRSKPRRWPLVLRFIKGAVHISILIPVICHALFTALIVSLDKYVYDSLGLPPTIIPSLSIVVGLILVFRNQTSYNRFWDGRNNLAAINASIRNLTRSILTHAYNPDGTPLTAAEKHDVERTIRVLMAIPYAVKNYLRAEWGAAWQLDYNSGDSNYDGSGGGGSASLSHAVESSNLLRHTESNRNNAIDGDEEDRPFNPEYSPLLPPGLHSHESEGLGLPLQLTFFVDSFLKRGLNRDWFPPPVTATLQAQLNALTDAYGRMETIKLTPIPVAHLIHQKQVLALFGAVLPFAMVDDMGWWAVPIVSLVLFTLYGIEGIGSQLEDPFGYDRNDIRMDAIVEDARVEIEAVLREWRRVLVEGEREREVRSVGAGSAGEYEPKEMFIRMRARTGERRRSGV